MSTMPTWKDEIAKLANCPQRQDSMVDQMMSLYDVAVTLGFYDAADYIVAKFVLDKVV